MGGGGGGAIGRIVLRCDGLVDGMGAMGGEVEARWDWKVRLACGMEPGCSGTIGRRGFARAPERVGDAGNGVEDTLAVDKRDVRAEPPDR